MNTEPRIIDVNGIAMNVLITGEGPDVLLVHGFPDCHTVWRYQVPALVAAGYRVIAPDTRGCGDSEILPEVADYKIENLVADLVGLLDTLGIEKIRLIAHDWGAAIAWRMVIDHPERVIDYAALSVGHPVAYARAGLAQKLKGYYVLLFQLRGIAEFLITCCNWLGLRLIARYPQEMENWRTSLGRPGRLTAAINYYRANLGIVFSRTTGPARVPVLGVWSSEDVVLAENQMVATEKYVEAPFRYRRVEGACHWLQLDAPDEINSILLEHLGEA